MNRIGYLVSELGAASHTFVRREIAALRARQVPIAAYSIRGDGGEDYKSVLGQSPFAYLTALAAALLLSPLRFLSTWTLSLTHRPRGFRHLLWSQFHFVEAIALARMLRADGCVHLHNHFANSGATVGMLAAHQAGIGWSLTLHGISETDYPAIATLKDKLERATFVACASRFMMAQGMRLVDRTEWRKFVLVRCGIDLSAMPQKNELAASDALKLVCVGRLSAEKGYFGLFEALAALPEGSPDFTLRIVGDGPEREALLRAVKDSGLDSRIDFLGALPEAQTLAEIAGADVLVLPSLMEGLPVVLMEARALGKPVVAPALAGIPELVAHGENGLLFAPADWEGLSAALATLLADGEMRKRLADGAARAFPAEFEIDEVARRLASIFEPMLVEQS